MLSPSLLSQFIKPRLRISTLLLPFMRSPQPFAVASMPMPSKVTPFLQPSMTMSPLSMTAKSVMLPIKRTHSGRGSLPFLKPFMISCSPTQCVFCPLLPVTTSSATSSLPAGVMYSTTADGFSVPSSLYAPEDVPFTKA